MDPVTFDAFEATALAEGFDEVLERRWAARTVLEPHTHPFALKARVVQGEMWLTVGDDVRHLLPGDTSPWIPACRMRSATAKTEPHIGWRAARAFGDDQSQRDRLATTAARPVPAARLNAEMAAYRPSPR